MICSFFDCEPRVPVPGTRYGTYWYRYHDDVVRVWITTPRPYVVQIVNGLTKAFYFVCPSHEKYDRCKFRKPLFTSSCANADRRNSRRHPSIQANIHAPHQISSSELISIWQWQARLLLSQELPDKTVPIWLNSFWKRGTLWVSSCENRLHFITVIFLTSTIRHLLLVPRNHPSFL